MFNEKPQKQDEVSNRPPPPKTDSALRDVFHNHKGQWPRLIPREPFEAADAWINLQEPPTPLDQPQWISKGTPNDPYAGGWQVPYSDRLVNNLRIFLALAPNEQEFVISKISVN